MPEIQRVLNSAYQQLSKSMSSIRIMVLKNDGSAKRLMEEAKVLDDNIATWILNSSTVAKDLVLRFVYVM